MNLITLLGAAVGCDDFADRLFSDAKGAAESLGLKLTEAELVTAKTVFNPKNRPVFSKHTKVIRTTFLCKKPPCPFIVDVPGLDCTCLDPANFDDIVDADVKDERKTA